MSSAHLSRFSFLCSLIFNIFIFGTISVLAVFWICYWLILCLADSLLNLEPLDAFCCFKLAWITMVMPEEIQKTCSTSQFLVQSLNTSWANQTSVQYFLSRWRIWKSMKAFWRTFVMDCSYLYWKRLSSVLRYLILRILILGCVVSMKLVSSFNSFLLFFL